MTKAKIKKNARLERWTRPHLRRLSRCAGLAAIVAATALAYASGLLQPVDSALSEMRFVMLQRPVSQSLTVVEIDVRSLRAAETWPWSRERYARAIDNLLSAGADVVAFDVDFSARSAEGADQAMEAAISRRPGSVVLPTFIQPVGEPGSRRMEGTRPLAAFSRDSILASVNIPLDRDGEVRRYHYAFGEGEIERATVAATLAGRPAGRAGDFLIDYSLRARDIDRLSFEAVYQGRFDPALVRGRKILIGATALELGDEFVTPRGAMPGVYIHALAYESIQAGRARAPMRPAALFILAGFAAFLLRPRGALALTSMLRRHALVAGGALLIPLAVQAALPVSIDASPVLLAQGLCLLWTTRAELRRRAQAVVEAREAHLLQLAAHMRKSRNRIRAANVKLKAANEALDGALRARTEFLAMTSHELRTPLNAILGMTQVLLADRAVADGVRQKVAAVQDAGESMQALVSDILDVAQLETGALEISPRPIRLRPILADLAASSAAEARLKGLSFVADIDAAPDDIEADPVRLRQIVLNLLSNAVKFTEQGQVRLTVGASTDAGGEHLVVEVSDTGVGVPAERLDQIFESFRQVDAGVTRRYGGAGLGLAICRQLAQAMGGVIAVRSEVGRGSTFTVRLPLVRAAAQPPAEAAPPADGLAGAAVLLVDGNPLFQRVLKAALTDHVASIEIVGSAEAALEALRSRRFGLILAEGRSLGASAPQEDVARLRREAPDARIAVLWEGAVEAEGVLESAGADQVLRKPLTNEALVMQLKQSWARWPNQAAERGETTQSRAV
jgi:signal transduction histidine kinase/ActR/RegA family two-component response regulator